MLSVGIDEARAPRRSRPPGVRGRVRRGRAPPQRLRRVRRRGRARIEELASHPGWSRSVRRASTTTATGLPPRTSAGHSGPRSRSRGGWASRWSSTFATAARPPTAPRSSETFEILRAEATGVTVVLHCFSAPAERALEAAERGWYCSFAGNVTYPKSEPLREAAREVPDELLLVETDAPFLSPQPRARQARTSRPTWSPRPRPSPSCAASATPELEATWSRGATPRASSAGDGGWCGSARTSSPTPICWRDRARGGGRARRRRARGRWGRGGADRPAGGAGGERARDRARRPSAARARGGRRRAPERQAALRRRDATRLHRARSGADADGRQPALLGRDPGDPADDRGARGGLVVDADGAARDRRPAAARPARAPTARPASSSSSPARCACCAPSIAPCSRRGRESTRR